MITFVRNMLGGVLTVIDLAVKSEAMGRAYAANAARSSWLDQAEESSEVLEPRSFVCNPRAEVQVDKDPEWVRDMIDATVAYAEGAGLMSAEQARAFIENDAPPCERHSCAREGYVLLRYNDIECDVCATEHADFPGAPIACGTAGCPNSSHPSAPGIPHRSAADRPGPIARADARGSGHQTSPDVAAGSQQRANVVGGVASADDLLPGVGAGQPIDREAHEALHEAANELEYFATMSGKHNRNIARRALAAEIRDLAHQFEADAQAEGA